MDKVFKATYKLYECRNTAKRFFGEEYADKIKPYANIIKTVMNENKINEVEALLLISKTEVYQDAGFGQLMFMAAVTELIDPNN